MENQILFKILVLTIYFAKCRADMEPYVIGGDFTRISKYPHSVFLQIRCNWSTWVCGSSILNQRILLTAAHCVMGCKRRWSIEAYAGHENIKKMNVIRSVKKFILHDWYDDHSMVNDIALLTLNQNLPLGKYIKRVTISKSHPIDVVATVAGWGIINRVTGEETIVLKSAKQRLMSPRSCYKYGFVYVGMMCAQSPEWDTTPSSGDSGSALVTADGQQIGLVSFVFREHLNTPVYTNVSYYFSWIKKKSQELHCN